MYNYIQNKAVFFTYSEFMDEKEKDYQLPPLNTSLAKTSYACSHLWGHTSMYLIPISGALRGKKITNV